MRECALHSQRVEWNVLSSSWLIPCCFFQCRVVDLNCYLVVNICLYILYRNKSIYLILMCIFKGNARGWSEFNVERDSREPYATDERPQYPRASRLLFPVTVRHRWRHVQRCREVTFRNKKYVVCNNTILVFVSKRYISVSALTLGLRTIAGFAYVIFLVLKKCHSLIIYMFYTNWNYDIDSLFKRLIFSINLVDYGKIFYL